MAVCNLASINLSAMVIPAPTAPLSPNRHMGGEVREGKATYDFEKLQHIAEVVTRNLNRVIDVNYYPIEEARNSNMRHRPIGIGVQVCSSSWVTSLAQDLLEVHTLSFVD